jgi:branched-chain amino acid transport system permease protein
MTNYIVQQCINGLQLGSIYALIALGYTLVYGIIKLINFAHADIFMVGAYIAFFVVSFYAGMSSFPPSICVLISLAIAYLITSVCWEKFIKNKFEFFIQNNIHLFFKKTIIAIFKLASMAILTVAIYPVFYLSIKIVFSFKLGSLLFPVLIIYVMFVCAILGITMERIAYKPLREKPRLLALITALGVSYFLENFCSLPFVFENKYRAFPEIISRSEIIHIPVIKVAITNIFAINIIICSILLFCLWFFVEKTLTGKQMRAVAYNHHVASLMGIDVNKIISLSFAIGPALAGVSGILYAMNYGVLQSPFLGFFPGLKAFIAAVLGGIGSLQGAVIGAFIMGISEVFANSIDSNLGFAVAFIILIVILLVKPTGIMGKTEQEKV